MAFPYHLWGAPNHYAIPAILPSNSPLVQNPEGAIRDCVEHSTNGDRTSLCDANQLKWFEEWAKNDDYRKLIMDVVKSRLDLGWPYNYKALDILAVMPASEVLGVNDKLVKLNEGTGEGSAEIKKLVKPLLEKVKVEVGKQEAEEMKKKEEAVLAMWGGMWANNGYIQPQLAGAGWGGFPYPYSAAGIVPGVSQPQPPVEWSSKAPEGWQPYVYVPSQPGPAYSYPVYQNWPAM
jgi:hypothetical protein